MIQLTNKQFQSIHKDYRGTTSEGKKSAFNASIRSRAGLKGWGEKGGTDLLIEDIHFEIVK
jgi:hypothetical protein